MQQPPGDPRYGRPQQPYAPPPAYAPPQAGYAAPAAQHAYGGPTPSHRAPGPQPSYGAPSPSYGGPAPQQGYPTPPPPSPWGSPLAVSVPRLGALGAGALGPAAGRLAERAPRGLPAPIAFGLGFAAVLVALVFDVIFLKVHIPGIGGYAWYLTTALSFAGAGWAGIKWTRASKGLAMAAVTVAAIVYGIADLGLAMFVEDLTLGGAISLGAQGLAIALFTGVGGVHKGARDKED